MATGTSRLFDATKHKENVDKRLHWEGIPPKGEYYESVLKHPGLFDMYEFRFHYMKDSDSRYNNIVKNLAQKWPDWSTDDVHCRAREIYLRMMAKRGIYFNRKLRL